MKIHNNVTVNALTNYFKLLEYIDLPTERGPTLLACLTSVDHFFMKTIKKIPEGNLEVLLNTVFEYTSRLPRLE